VNSETTIQFPESAEAVVATLTALFRHQGKNAVCSVLENATPEIRETDYDNLDGGMYVFTLYLGLPLKVFAPIENEVHDLEKVIANKFPTVFRNTGHAYLRYVAISPVLEQPLRIGQAKVPPMDYEHLWENGMLRLFLSHVSAHKKNVAELKADFRSYGVSAFVAHEDIEPNAEWLHEIELALQSMDALVALLTPDFHQSKWTDQEVGFAMGSNRTIISVRLGTDPYGFIGKFQGLPGSFETPTGG
jgi:hypothetical protein